MSRVETARSEQELSINIRKATSMDETAPKRKHVRSCIVYTWDHKSSVAFWAAMKVYVLSPRVLLSRPPPNRAL
jgi:hypothetical protein